MSLNSFLRQLVLSAPGLLFCALAWAEATPRVVTEDIRRFWAAYDHVRQESDPSKKKQWLQAEYLDRGSPGLKAFVESKRCSADKYVDALNKYPRFWNSVRANTLAIDVPSVDVELKKFRSLYPEMRPANAYAVIGCMTSNGTTVGDKVLIGAEIAAGDPHVDLSELPDAFRQRLSAYFATEPTRKLTLLMVHEYVHTQQPDVSKATLLGQVLGEGGADFVAERITGKVPDLRYMSYGPAHEEAIKRQFAKDMDKTAYDDWLYNDADNAFGVSDLGYYVGYAICKAYYSRAVDKRAALRDIIRLNSADPAAAHAFLDRSGYLAR